MLTFSTSDKEKHRESEIEIKGRIERSKLSTS